MKLFVWKPPMFLLESTKFNNSNRNQNHEKKPLTLLATWPQPVVSNSGLTLIDWIQSKFLGFEKNLGISFVGVELPNHLCTKLMHAPVDNRSALWDLHFLKWVVLRSGKNDAFMDELHFYKVGSPRHPGKNCANFGRCEVGWMRWLLCKSEPLSRIPLYLSFLNKQTMH